MTCDRCGAPCQGRLCTGCRAVEHQEGIGTAEDFIAECEGCGAALHDARTQHLPDGSSRVLCEGCREGYMRMWARFALQQPQQANRVRARANSERLAGRASE